MKIPTSLFFLNLLLSSCTPHKPLQVKVENDLDFERKEVVSIAIENLGGIAEKDLKHVHVQDVKTKKYQRTQLLDIDGDGTFEDLLFRAEVPANGTSEYHFTIDSAATVPESDVIAYSRFVPERTDDYTWENDKVAFRTYGPTGQKEALGGVAGSTLSSGIDLWLKRTDKSIINKWYAGHIKNPGFYHTDRGEGYDPYHVGDSRGTGGVGVWNKDSLYVSKNYIQYKTIADGPLRTVFELSYAPWSPYNIQETKRITLDLGSNFSKFEIDLSADDSIPNLAVGITMHKNEGDYQLNEDQGWFRYWETIDDSYIGEGIVMSPKEIDSAFARITKATDQSNILVLAKPQKKITYYAGFAWKKSGQVTTVEDWDKLLSKQAEIINSPLNVIWE